MNIELEKIRFYRLRAHNLSQKLPLGKIADAAGACGLQNSPPGAWETALFNRVDSCTADGLQSVLYREKSLLQAWSYRGVPLIFPTGQSDIFLSPLIAKDGEQPWIYTRGITAALDFLHMEFGELLPLVKKAAAYLNEHTIQSKELLDQTLAELIRDALPPEKQLLWEAPSMYGQPDRQTVGGAAVSFMLRPCSFFSLVVFGERRGNSPVFTSFQNWTGRAPSKLLNPEKELVRKYLHCFGPSKVSFFMDWLGCSKAQAKRLWNCAAEEMEPVLVNGKKHFMLCDDLEALRTAAPAGDSFILLGPHDPYLDMKDRYVILENTKLHREVWRTAANPGVILKNGKIAGTWKPKRKKDRLELDITLFDALTLKEHKKLSELAEQYASFHGFCLSRVKPAVMD